MTYIYPQFSEFEIPGVRLAGPGLGNLLLIYFRAWLAAKEHGYAFIWPTWPSLKPGAIIRREKDKRFYGDVFRNRSGYTDGIKKQLLIRRRDAVRRPSGIAVRFPGEPCIRPVRPRRAV